MPAFGPGANSGSAWESSDMSWRSIAMAMTYPKCSVQSPVFLTDHLILSGLMSHLIPFFNIILFVDRPTRTGASVSRLATDAASVSVSCERIQNGWDHWNQPTVAVWPTNATLEAPWTEKSKRMILPSREGMNQSPRYPRYPSYIHLYGVFATASSATKHFEGVSDSQGTVPQNLNRNYSRMFRLGTWNTWNTWNGISCFNHLEMCLIFHGMEPEMECVWSYEILWYPHGSQQESIHGPAVLSPSIRKSPRRDGTEFRLRFSWLNDCLDMWI